MDTQYNSKKIFCDSDNPNATGSNNMRKQFTLANPIIIPPQSKIKMLIGVEAVSIPLSFYVFNSSNNVIRYSDNNNNVDNYTLDVGNYTITRLVTTINANSAIPFGLSFDRETAKLKITDPNTPSTITEFQIHDVENNAYGLLGMTVGNYTLGDVFTNTINLVYTSGVSIAINNIENLNDEANPNASSKKLIRIPITTSINTYLTFFNNQPFYSTINNKVLNFLDVSILDDSGRLLETNGNHFFHITFRIDFTKPAEELLDKTLIQKFRNSLIKNPIPQEESPDKETKTKK